MTNPNIHEAWAQALVAKQMDVAAAWDVVYPDGPNSRLKSAKSKIARFNELIAVNPALWKRVADLQNKVDEHLALTAADVLKQYEIIATTDRRRMVSVVDVIAEGTGQVIGQRVQLAPTDSYSDAEALVYEGAEQTLHGIKLHMASKSDAREALARHHGLFNDKLLLAKTGELPDLPPLPDDPVEAARLYAEWVKN
jgi:hypothetical protein